MSAELYLQNKKLQDLYVLNVFVDAYDSSVELAPDGRTPIGQNVRVTGSALIAVGPNYSDFFTAVRVAGNRLKTARLEITVGAATTNLFNFLDADSDNGGPYFTFTTTEVVGTKTALLRFEVTTRRSFPNGSTEGSNQTVMAHRWVQSIAMDASGQLTRTINGSINIARSTTGATNTLATNAAWTSKLPYADLFRNAIIPDVPGPGWRRESQDFALDESSTVLFYNVIDKRFVIDLPDGVRVGDMEASYERTLENAGVATVHFSVDLLGDAGLQTIAGTTPNRRLVEAAMALCKTRIDLNFKQTIVQRMKVTENRMLEGYSVRFEVDATVQSKAQDNAATLAPLGYMIGQKFTVTKTATRTLPAYGPALTDGANNVILGILPHWLNNNVSGTDTAPEANMPRAQLFSFAGSNEHGAVNVAVVSGADGVSAMNSLFAGAFNAFQQQPENVTIEGTSGYATTIANSRSHTSAVIDNGMVRASTMYPSGQDLVFQTRKPRVLLTEHVEVVRMNQAPSKIMRELPANCVVKSEDWRVAFGKYDAQGQRVFTGVFERTMELYDPGGTPVVGFYNNTIGGVTFRNWVAPNSTIIAARNPNTTDGGQLNTTGVLAAAVGSQAYGVTGQAIAT
jgi:hypothetical protein